RPDPHNIHTHIHTHTHTHITTTHRHVPDPHIIHTHTHTIIYTHLLLLSSFGQLETEFIRFVLLLFALSRAPFTYLPQHPHYDFSPSSLALSHSLCLSPSSSLSLSPSLFLSLFLPP